MSNGSSRGRSTSICSTACSPRPARAAISRRTHTSPRSRSSIDASCTRTTPTLLASPACAGETHCRAVTIAGVTSAALLAADGEQVAFVARQRVDVDDVVAGLDGGGVVGDLLALGVVHGDGQADLGLVDDLDQGGGGRAVLEADRLGLLLGERLVRAGEQLELVPGRERRLLELLLELLELAVDRWLVARGGGELEEVALGGDVGAGEPGRRQHGRQRDRGEQGSLGHISSASASSGVTQITAALPSSSAR